MLPKIKKDVSVKKKKNPPSTYKGKHPKRVLKLIKSGHEPICVCCGKKNTLTFDHIIPTVKGGSNSDENGQILCYRCNNRKGSKILTIVQLRKIVLNDRFEAGFTKPTLD